jgi:phosphoglycolate phosphatase-like HAD superfamily hydrolase
MKVLIFDIDMTICDPSIRRRKALERAILEGSKGILGHAFEHFFFDEDLFETDVPLNNAAEMLRELSPSYGIYYLTGRPLKRTAEDFLEKHGFPDGAVFATKVAPGEGKKKTALFKEILKDACITAEDAVSIADLSSDAIAAKELGIKTIGTCQATKQRRASLERSCDFVIGNISELPEAIEAVFK